MAMEEMIGVLAALGSVLLFGSYAVPIRFPHVMAAQIDPMIFQFYKSTACFASSWLLLLFVPLRFTWWGLAGGGLWVMTGVGAITAVQLAGIGTAQALWSGLSIFVSYLWGAFYFKEPIRNYGLSLLALAIMAIGMIGVGSAASGSNLPSSSGTKYQKSPPQSPQASKARHEYQTLDSDPLTKTLIPDDEESVPLPIPTDLEKPSKSEETRFTQGVLCAILVGVLNGSFMLPLKFANRDIVGAEYIFSFGMGAMAITTLVLAAYFLARFIAGKPNPKFQFRVAALPALTTGILWSMGNFCSVYATLYLGMSLGWPMVQCQILVSSLWAVFFYEEVVGRESKAVLLGSSAMVVCGVVLLSQVGTYT